MKKKFVSSIVFMMLVAGFQARAQEVAVDKGVMGVENDDKHSAFSETYDLNCKETGPNSSVVLKIKNFLNGNENLANVIVENGTTLGLAATYTATVNYENSFLYDVTTYAFVDENKNTIGEFVVSENKPMPSRGGNFCGRAGCGFPTHPIVKTYSALLKMQEKEITFTCQ